MNLIRSNDPFDGLSGLHKQLDDMFNSLWSAPSLPRMAAASTMDIYNDDDKHMVVEIHAPGFKKEDIEVQINEGSLEIKGEKSDTSESKDKQRTYMLKESSSSFYRRIMLPRNVDSAKIAAHFTDGTLKLSIPFKELPQPTRVQIQASGDAVSDTK